MISCETEVFTQRFLYYERSSNITVFPYIYYELNQKEKPEHPPRLILKSMKILNYQEHTFTPVYTFLI